VHAYVVRDNLIQFVETLGNALRNMWGATKYINNLYFERDIERFIVDLVKILSPIFYELMERPLLTNVAQHYF